MDSAIVITTAAFCVLGALVLTLPRAGEPLVITPLFLFAGASTLFINTGFIISYLQEPDAEASWPAIISVSVGVLMVAIGGCIARGRRWPKASRGIPPYSLVVRDITYRQAMIAGLFVILMASVYFILLGSLPIFTVLRSFITGGYTSGLMSVLRGARDPYSNAEAQHLPLQGLWEIVRYSGLPIVVVWFLHYLRCGVHRWLSAAMIAACITLCVSTGQRWPLMNMLFTIVIYWLWTAQSRKRALNDVIKIMTVALVAGIGLSVLLGRGASNVYTGDTGAYLGVGSSDLFNRILLGNVIVPFHSYELFPNMYDWLYGGSYWQDVSAFMPGMGESFPVTFGRMAGGQTRGFTCPPDFYTEAYINFSWFGVIFVSLVWGWCLTMLSQFIATRSRLVDISFMSMLTMQLAMTAVAGVVGNLGGAIVAIIMVRFALWAARFIDASHLHAKGDGGSQSNATELLKAPAGPHSGRE